MAASPKSPAKAALVLQISSPPSGEATWSRRYECVPNDLRSSSLGKGLLLTGDPTT
jgi:hypothetical protein